jgi:cell fate (sporulation/competence/biofilm development) regulator YlbF (YheA/YmcA/DUF963 family)
MFDGDKNEEAAALHEAYLKAQEAYDTVQSFEPEEAIDTANAGANAMRAQSAVESLDSASELVGA